MSYSRCNINIFSVFYAAQMGHCLIIRQDIKSSQTDMIVLYLIYTTHPFNSSPDDNMWALKAVWLTFSLHTLQSLQVMLS